MPDRCLPPTAELAAICPREWVVGKEEGHQEEEEEKEQGEEEEEKQEHNKNEEKEQGEEEEEEVEEEEDAEEEAEQEKQQFSSQLCPGPEALQQVALQQDDGRSCQAQLVATAQTHGEEPTPGPRGTWDVAASATDGDPPERSPAHPEEPPGEEARAGSSPQPQLPESEKPIRAQASFFIPLWGFSTSLRKWTPCTLI
ncbi:cilia- and flagella-associated protein 251-like isoform X1 [Fukomys damarensis]|uniref:cilia- and flagella-associated protein 251-like isoform X1 n=1 Tax=Fukomys damarensis TaxID=885580 RepID=UPI0005401747|nr:cilia- and flagella-associated protein 251-like isoform X1 [Fukomys damarensis]